MSRWTHFYSTVLRSQTSDNEQRVSARSFRQIVPRANILLKSEAGSTNEQGLFLKAAPMNSDRFSSSSANFVVLSERPTVPLGTFYALWKSSRKWYRVCPREIPLTRRRTRRRPFLPDGLETPWPSNVKDQEGDTFFNDEGSLDHAGPDLYLPANVKNQGECGFINQGDVSNTEPLSKTGNSYAHVGEFQKMEPLSPAGQNESDCVSLSVPSDIPLSLRLRAGFQETFHMRGRRYIGIARYDSAWEVTSGGLVQTSSHTNPFLTEIDPLIEEFGSKPLKTEDSKVFGGTRSNGKWGKKTLLQTETSDDNAGSCITFDDRRNGTGSQEHASEIHQEIAHKVYRSTNFTATVLRGGKNDPLILEHVEAEDLCIGNVRKASQNEADHSEAPTWGLEIGRPKRCHNARMPKADSFLPGDFPIYKDLGAGDGCADELFSAASSPPRENPIVPNSGSATVLKGSSEPISGVEEWIMAVKNNAHCFSEGEKSPLLKNSQEASVSGVNLGVFECDHTGDASSTESGDSIAGSKRIEVGSLNTSLGFSVDTGHVHNEDFAVDKGRKARFQSRIQGDHAGTLTVDIPSAKDDVAKYVVEGRGVNAPKVNSDRKIDDQNPLRAMRKDFDFEFMKGILITILLFVIIRSPQIRKYMLFYGIAARYLGSDFFTKGIVAAVLLIGAICSPYLRDFLVFGGIAVYLSSYFLDR